MDIRIGVTDTPRELNLVLGTDADRDEIKSSISAAIGGASDTLWLIDEKGREVAVPASRIAYVELSAEGENNPIGFG